MEPKYAKYMKSPFRDTKPDRVPKPVQPSTHTPAEPVFTSGNASENYIAASPNEEGDEKKVSQFPAIFGGGNAAGTTKVGKKHSPGIVLDENGKPCKVCNSWQTWTKATKKGIHTDASPVSTILVPCEGTIIFRMVADILIQSSAASSARNPSDRLSSRCRRTWTSYLGVLTHSRSLLP